MKRRNFIKLVVGGLVAGSLGGIWLSNLKTQETKKIEEVSEKLSNFLFFEIHDVSPFFFEEIKRLNEIFDEFGINKREYFLIPAAPNDLNLLTKHPEFVNYIKKEVRGKFELGNHGLYHFPMDEINGLYEFSHLNRKETLEKYKKAVEIHKKFFGMEPKGAAFPNWAYSSEALAVFTEKFEYVSDLKLVFGKNRNVIGEALPITWQIKKPIKRLEWFREWLKHYEPRNLRLVLHPQDTHSKDFPSFFERLLKEVEQDYSLKSYAEILV